MFYTSWKGGEGKGWDTLLFSFDYLGANTEDYCASLMDKKLMTKNTELTMQFPDSKKPGMHVSKHVES